ncbi:hypothetical protein V1502_10925 [Bacillus sp. SCS-153A]|uniref:hypothetical protein n=1 Tax=Rossellomorea sedimentorum TaxID=3115294 RepID=UPI003905F485
MNNITQMILLLLTTIVVVILYRKSKEDEPYLLIKLFGFTFLGAFFLDFNELRLPLGFVVILLLFRKLKVNVEPKFTAASFGWGLMVLSIMIPQIESIIFERTHYVDVLDDNFYSGSLMAELQHIKDEFDMEHDTVELRGLEMTIHQDGRYNYLSMGLAEETHEGTVNYSIDLSHDRKTFEVTRYKVREEDEEYLNDFMFTDAGLVLGNLDLITSSMLDFPGEKFYQFRTDGQRIVYDTIGDSNYQVNTAGIFKVENDKLPVKAIVVDVCASKEVKENRYAYKCGPFKHFLFDALKYEEALNQSTVLDVARRQSLEIDEWVASHIGDSVGHEKYGVEEKVKESEYIKALKETPRSSISFNQQENIWDVKIETLYGDAPHTMEFKLNAETRTVTELTFR